MNVDLEKAFDYENGFYLASSVERISKFATHLDLFRRTSGQPGEIVECGVFKGASLCRWVKFRALFENTFSRKLVAFDVFGEFPPADYEPDRKPRESFVSAAGERSIGRAELLGILAELGLDENVELVEGDVRRTAPAYVAEHPELRISLLHVDVDLYEPTKACLEALGPRVVPHGLIILDDYGVFPGASKAVEEYLWTIGAGTIAKLSYSHAVSFLEVQEGMSRVAARRGRTERG